MHRMNGAVTCRPIGSPGSYTYRNPNPHGSSYVSPPSAHPANRHGPNASNNANLPPSPDLSQPFGRDRNAESYSRCVFSGESPRSEEHTSELQSRENLVCRLLLEKQKHKQSR